MLMNRHSLNYLQRHAQSLHLLTDITPAPYVSTNLSVHTLTHTYLSQRKATLMKKLLYATQCASVSTGAREGGGGGRHTHTHTHRGISKISQPMLITKNALPLLLVTFVPFQAYVMCAEFLSLWKHQWNLHFATNCMTAIAPAFTDINLY